MDTLYLNDRATLKSEQDIAPKRGGPDKGLTVELAAEVENAAEVDPRGRDKARPFTDIAAKN